MTFTVDCNLPDVSTRCWVTKCPISLSINSEQPPNLFFPINFIHHSFLLPVWQFFDNLGDSALCNGSLFAAQQSRKLHTMTRCQWPWQHMSLLLALCLSHWTIRNPVTYVLGGCVSNYHIFFLWDFFHMYLLIFTPPYFFWVCFLFLIFFSLSLKFKFVRMHGRIFLSVWSGGFYETTKGQIANWVYNLYQGSRTA